MVILAYWIRFCSRLGTDSFIRDNWSIPTTLGLYFWIILSNKAGVMLRPPIIIGVTTTRGVSLPCISSIWSSYFWSSLSFQTPLVIELILTFDNKVSIRDPTCISLISPEYSSTDWPFFQALAIILSNVQDLPCPGRPTMTISSSPGNIPPKTSSRSSNPVGTPSKSPAFSAISIAQLKRS